MIENYSDEISWLKEQLDLNPKSMLFARLAERYLQMDEIDQAINVCKRGLMIHEDYATAHLVLARCYIKNQQFDEAERELKNVLNYDPKTLSAHKLYSELMQKIGREETVKTSYQKILDIDPLDDHVKNLLTELPANEGPPEPFEPLMEPETEEKEEPFASIFDEEAQPEPEAEQPLADALEEEAGTESEKPFKSVFNEEVETDSEKDLQISAAETGLLNDEEFSDSGIIDQTLEIESEDIKEPELKSTTTSEEARFSEILEDIFSPTLDEEEKQDEDARTALERVANEDLEELPTVTDETLVSEKEQQVEKTPDELAVEEPAETKSTVEEDTESEENKAVKETPPEEATTPGEKENKRNGTNFLDTEINPFDLDEELTPEESHEPPQFEGVDLDEDEQKEAALGDFLSSLSDEEDFQSLGAPEEKKPTESDKPEAPELEKREEEEGDQMDVEEMTISTPTEKAEKPKERFVTPTLGEIYAAQGQYAKAINVFELLVEKHPDNEWYQSKLEYLKKRLEEEGS